MDIAHVQGYVSVRVNDDQLGVKFVRIQYGQLWWSDSQEQVQVMESLSIVETAQSVKGNSGRILILFPGDVLVCLFPDESSFLIWFEAVSAWIPNSAATRKLLRSLAKAVRDGGGSNATSVVAVAPSFLDRQGGRSNAAVKEMDSWLSRMSEMEHKAELLTLELTQTKAELVNTAFLLREADTERKDLQKKLENVSSAVRLKAIGLLLNSNRDLANLKLQIDCYQEQIQYFANENEKLTTRYEALLAKKDVMLDGYAEALKIAREDRQRLRKALIDDDKGLNVDRLLEDIERLRRSYFFSLGSQLRQASSLSSATSGNFGVPDLSKLYDEFCDLPEDQWRTKLAGAFGAHKE